MSTHEDLLNAIKTYEDENRRFEKNGFNTAATRARKALSEIARLAKERRKEILASRDGEESEE